MATRFCCGTDFLTLSSTGQSGTECDWPPWLKETLGVVGERLFAAATQASGYCSFVSNSLYFRPVCDVVASVILRKNFIMFEALSKV